jgi:hypothetical protein
MGVLAFRTQRRIPRVLAIVTVLAFPAGLAASCTQSDRPQELAAGEAGPPDVTTREASADVTSAPDVVEVGSNASDASTSGDGEAEAACVPAGDAGATVSPVSVSFGANNDGLVGCGAQALAKPVTITNDSCNAFTFTAVLTSGANYYTLSPSTGTVAPGTVQTVQVIPDPIPQTSAVTHDLYEGTVNITTTAPGDTGHPVQLHMTAYGAIIQSLQFGQTLDFGGVSIGQTASAQFAVTNIGNAPADLTFAVGSQFFTVTPTFSTTPSVPVAPQVTFKPTNVQPYSDTITTTVAAGTPLCADPPPTTPIKGTGTTGIIVSPTNLDFGLVQCGQPAAPYLTTKITNTGAATTFTLTFVKGPNSPYTLADDATGTSITPGTPVNLAAASSATVRVVPKQIPNPAVTAADTYADTLTITTTSTGDSPHNVSLHETAQGTIFTLSPPSVSTSAPSGFAIFVNFQVGNTGNLSAGYTLAAVTTQGAPNTFSSNLSTGTLAAGANETGILTCIGPPAPDGGGHTQYLGTLTLTPDPGTVLCADPPPPMPLSITNQ